MRTETVFNKSGDFEEVQELVSKLHRMVKYVSYGVITQDELVDTVEVLTLCDYIEAMGYDEGEIYTFTDELSTGDMNKALAYVEKLLTMWRDKNSLNEVEEEYSEGQIQAHLDRLDEIVSEADKLEFMSADATDEFADLVQKVLVDKHNEVLETGEEEDLIGLYKFIAKCMKDISNF